MSVNQSQLGRMGSALFASLTLGATATLPAVASQFPRGVIAQQPPGDVPLFERPSFINTCRNRGNTPLPIFSDSALSRNIGTLPALTRITLTGVLGTGIAQVRSGNLVGYVRSATLLTNCNPEPPPADVCFQVVTNNLTLRAAPSSTGAPITSLFSGDRIFAANPPRRTNAETRTWLQVTFRGNTGWVAETGANGIGRNVVPCS